MALAAATGPWASPQDSLRTTLSYCKYFQTWSGAANQAAALAKIHNYDLTAPTGNADTHTLAALQALRPFAAVFTEPQGGLTISKDSGGASFGYSTRGNLVCWLEDDITSQQAADIPALDRTIQNAVGKIIASADLDNPGLLELAGQAGYLAIREMTVYG